MTRVELLYHFVVEVSLGYVMLGYVRLGLAGLGVAKGKGSYIASDNPLHSVVTLNTVMTDYRPSAFARTLERESPSRCSSPRPSRSGVGVSYGAEPLDKT